MAPMKKKTAEMLTGLVALRRQKAEQALGRANAALQAAERQLETVRAEARRPPPSDDFDAILLAERFGNALRLRDEVAQAARAVNVCKTEVQARREALKQAFGSQQSLAEITGHKPKPA